MNDVGEWHKPCVTHRGQTQNAYCGILFMRIQKHIYAVTSHGVAACWGEAVSVRGGHVGSWPVS